MNVPKIDALKQNLKTAIAQLEEAETITREDLDPNNFAFLVLRDSIQSAKLELNRIFKGFTSEIFPGSA